MDVFEDLKKRNIYQIKKELYEGNMRCSLRGLKKTAKWHAELLYALDQVDAGKIISSNEVDFSISSLCKEYPAEFDKYLIAKSFFDADEYDRAAHFTNNCKSPVVSFLHYYSIYLSGERKKVDNEITSTSPDSKRDNHLKILHVNLTKQHLKGNLDAYGLYLYGLVLKKLEMKKAAIDRLVECISLEPIHWGAWLELSGLITNKQMLQSLALPDSHWMYAFFIAHLHLEIQYNEQALKFYKQLSESQFSRSTYVMSQLALAHHNLRDVDLAIEAFDKVMRVDPYRLENMDVYSNLLYIREMKSELAYLAHHCSDIDRFRAETCCVTGNYYSLRHQHDKAVLYFERAVKLDPNYISAWTLMGHEYMELKSTSAAILAYRQAIDVTRRDYRAWYGLGQTYEILKMPYFAAYYYQQAHYLRPNDSRMAVALGEAFDNLGKLQEAKRCYWKAKSLGDIEGLALIKLAKLYERLHENDHAAGAYTGYINETSHLRKEGQGQAYKFLANYYLMTDNLEEAYFAAQTCINYPEVKEEGKALLRQISDQRATKLEDQNSSKELSQRTLPAAESTDVCSPMSLTYTP